MQKILIINGPNLNLLGKRDPKVYGNKRFEEYFEVLKKLFKEHELFYFQSNIEGEIINSLHESMSEYNGVVLNAGGYTHTSVAIRDAIEAINIPVVEVHISNVLSREDFRHQSIIGPVCSGSIIGFGFDSYRLAIESLRIMLK